MLGLCSQRARDSGGTPCLPSCGVVMTLPCAISPQECSLQPREAGGVKSGWDLAFWVAHQWAQGRLGCAGSPSRHSCWPRPVDQLWSVQPAHPF